MSESLIIVKQLPVIEERLKTISEEIRHRTQEALSLACTEETVKEIKKVRANLSKSFKELETQRKDVRSKVLSPYEQFEAIYRTCVTEVFAPADAELKRRIDEVELAVKEEKRVDVATYFDEYVRAKSIDFLDFGKSGIQVTMSASTKALRTQAKDFIDRVVEELELIETQQFKEEILVEYKRSLNVANAITSVSNRHAAIEAERKRAEEARIARGQRDTAARKVEAVVAEEVALAPPEVNGEAYELPLIVPETVPAEKMFKATFTVLGTMEQLKALKTFLEDGGYGYESC